MNRFFPLIGVLLTVVPAAALAQQRGPAVDPVLRAATRPSAIQAIERTIRGPEADSIRAQLQRLVSIRFDRATGEPRIDLLARLSGPDALATLRAAGAEIGTVLGGVATASVPLTAVESLRRSGQFSVLQAARIVQPTHDSSMIAIGAHRVRVVGSGDWRGAAGADVIVGVYDTGIDYAHPDFLDPSGEPRILGIWDHTDDTTGVNAGLPYGYYCDQGSLRTRRCPQRDLNGHGTHTAGTAGGDGSATGEGGVAYRYAGVAPAADLLIVKGGNSGFSETSIIDGLKWMSDEATRLGKPLVVNMSIGGQYGAHDGSRLYEQVIDSLSGAGRIFVISAGNDGANYGGRTIHGMTSLQAGVTSRMEIEVGSYDETDGGANDYFVADLWYEGGDTVDIAVIRPDGSRVEAPFGTYKDASGSAGRVYLENAAAGADPANGDFEAFLIGGDYPDGSAPQAGTWTIEFTPRATHSGEPVHMWVYASTMDATVGQGSTNSHLVGSPATADRAIAVGAFMTRRCWPAGGGNRLCANGLQAEIGDIADFSSVGPTRDGRLKPDIAAPGAMIISAAASTAFGGYRIDDGVHAANAGTSMAAPHVAGAVALMLEEDPTLTPEDVKAILAQTAGTDAYTENSYVTGDPFGEATPNATWGAGKLDVYAALQHMGAISAPLATLVVDAAKVEMPETPSSRKGERIGLLQLSLTASGTEAIEVLGLGFDVTGRDPGAEIVLVRDLDGDGVADTDEPVAGSAAAVLDGDETHVSVGTPSLEVAAGTTTRLVVAIEMSGEAPNGASFQATFLPDATKTIGAASQAINATSQPTTTIASDRTRTTVLRSDEVLALSENPVQSGRPIIMNFSSEPNVAAVYTIAGRRVIDLKQLIQGGNRVEWDFTNDQGTPVVPGVYLLIFDIDGKLERRKLFIVRTSPTGVTGG